LPILLAYSSKLLVAWSGCLPELALVELALAREKKIAHGGIAF
jgi:hypothetical protein